MMKEEKGRKREEKKHNVRRAPNAASDSSVVPQKFYIQVGPTNHILATDLPSF